MDYRKLCGMKVEELKCFLRSRGLRCSGRKEELVARAFLAYENNMPALQTAEEVEKEISTEYRLKLVVEDTIIPDPYLMDNGWLNEEEGLSCWPSIKYPEIFNFLSFKPSELQSQDLYDYKTSKAYSYYSRGWLEPVMFNANNDSPYCLLKGLCTPSERLNDPPHKMWVCVRKDDARIVRAHCSCMAGISQACNHVAALLFRIVAAVRLGLTDPSCTSKPCEWLPNTSVVRPQKIRDLNLNRDAFGGKTSKRKIYSSPRKRYKPIDSDAKLDLKAVADALKEIIPNSLLYTATAIGQYHSVQNVELRNLTQRTTFGSLSPSTNTPTTPLPAQPTDSLCTGVISDTCAPSLAAILSKCVNGDTFFRELTCMSAGDVEAIEAATRKQAKNKVWFTCREHVITASRAHAVKTKMISKRRPINFLPLFRVISGQNFINPNIPSLRYGREMEAKALKVFLDEQRKCHTNAKLYECGLFLVTSIPFVGGSPDGIFTCDCCGKACVEVKCPYSIRDKSPMDAKLDFLNIIGDSKQLNRNHKFYTQVQVQMAATGINTSNFFVYSDHGHYTERILFDEDYWNRLKPLFKDFYLNYYIHFLFNNEKE